MHLRNFIAVAVLLVIVYVVTNYAGPIQEQLGIKGVSGKGQGIAGQIGKDVGGEVGLAEQQVMQLKVSDVVNEISRFKRIPQDVKSITSFTQTQISNVLESKDKKK